MIICSKSSNSASISCSASRGIHFTNNDRDAETMTGIKYDDRSMKSISYGKEAGLETFFEVTLGRLLGVLNIAVVPMRPISTILIYLCIER